MGHQPFGSLHVAVMHKQRSGSGSLSRAGLQLSRLLFFLVAFFGSRRWWWLGRWRKWIGARSWALCFCLCLVR